MAISRVMKTDDMIYDADEYDRPTTAPLHKPTTVLKYIGHRTVGLNLPTTFQGSLRNFALTTTGSTLPPPSLISADHGLISLVHSSPYSTLSLMHSIDGERITEEQRELAKLNETLTEAILQCCSLDVHNRAQELQVEWFENNANRNSSSIDKMFRTEVQTAQELIEEASRNKPDLERKLNDIHRTTLANDEHYQQLLSKRNAANKEVFDYHRYLAQTRAEAEFLRYRVQYFDDEIHFYTLKNECLESRKTKLHYEVDEETFAQQVLEMELEALKNEKITNEDLHFTAVDDAREAVELAQIVSIQPSNYYREQLTHLVRRMRSEHEKTIEKYREKLHRKFELEHHRYQMCKSRPVPIVTKEHEDKLNQFQYEKKTIEKQIISVQSSINDVQTRVDLLEEQVQESHVDRKSTTDLQKKVNNVRTNYLRTRKTIRTYSSNSNRT